MLRKRYPAGHRAAMLVLALGVMLSAGCAPKKPETMVQKPMPGVHLPSPPGISADINALMRLALEEGNSQAALAGLERLAAEAEPPLNIEARFRRVQLLLLIGDDNGISEAERLLTLYPDHVLIPYLHLWMAQWMEIHRDDGGVLAHTAAALMHPRLTLEIASRVASLGAAAARRSPDWEAVQWLLSAAHSVMGQRDTWLRQAADRASIAMIGRLRDSGRLGGKTGKAFYLHAARAHLITGDMAAVQTLSSWLSKDFPYTKAAMQVAAWTAGVTHAVSIGALLPLTGKYARYGEQALRGMRLALASLEADRQITLHIADTGGGVAQCPAAYQRLTDKGVAMILGPLLGDCAAALAPYLQGNAPVLSMTSRSEAAKKSPMLFVHTLALAVQARFMAESAWQQGERRMVIAGADSPSSRQEADAFAQAFEELGGVVVDRFVLQRGSIDFRSQLRAMRMRTDDMELLAELDDELGFSAQPEKGMEIIMPVHFDAMYLALPGKQVSLLAGQLAYVDIKHVRLYGSGRWQDGHLLADKGRYLGRARFSDVAFPNGASPGLRHFTLAWRDAWGVGKPIKLTGLAYDSTLIAALLTSRLGLSGRDVLAGLNDKDGFPGLTGHVRFDADGIGHKSFKMFRIRHGRIVPAG